MEECGEFRHGEDFPALLNCLKCIIYENCYRLLFQSNDISENECPEM